jgi:hypothetical protein
MGRAQALTAAGIPSYVKKSRYKNAAHTQTEGQIMLYLLMYLLFIWGRTYGFGWGSNP